MAFCSLAFPAFFAAAALLFWFLPRALRGPVLLAADLAFMTCWGVPSLGVLAGVTLLTYGCGLGLAAARTPRARRVRLVLGLVCSAGYVFARKAVALAAPGTALLTAVGLSFYALQAASYLADVYLGRCPAQRSLLRYAIYLSFFPRITSGPIGRAAEFFPQLDALLAGQRQFSPARASHGLVLMLAGYAQKLILAEPLNVLVDTVYAAPTAYGGAVLFTAAAAFGLALYYDFAGYSLIARGAAQALGIGLAVNFRRPYFAQSFSEFWRRWHISLSSWLRDYVYIPLGGSRLGRGRKYLNLLLTFLASGLWHGTGLQYLFWGALHAGYQILGDLTRPLRARPAERLPRRGPAFLAVWARRLFILLCADWAWLFFRAPSLGAGFAVANTILTDFRPAQLTDGTLLGLGLSAAELWAVGAALLIAFVLACRAERAEAAGTTLQARFAALPQAVRWPLLVALGLAVLLFACRMVGGDAADFYYAKF